MKKMSLTFLAAGAMALAGVAQADAIFYPDGTMVELGENGADTLALDSSTRVDTTVLGAAPASAAVTTVATVPQLVYVQPNINWDRSTAMTQLRSNVHLVNKGVTQEQRTQAAATFDVPARAGEATTMTGGAPNMVTDNGSFVVGSYSIPHSVVVSEPYYVFSY
ncbi:MAG TPA: hypothetical protein VGD76_02905 [Ramlibacter sp.]